MHRQKKIVIWLLIIVLFFLAILGAGSYYQKVVLNGYPDTPNFLKKIDQLQADEDSQYVLVFHKPGCSKCEHIRSTVKEVIKTNHRYNYIVIDVTKKEAKALFIKYGITQVPTIIHLRGNQVVSSTTSTEPQQVKKVMTGEN